MDTIIFGTGFHVTDMPVMRQVHGRDGRSLAEAWSPTMTAYLGTTIAGFPNLFVLLGPNTGLGHNSVVFMIEAQLRHLLDVLDHQRRHGLTATEPTAAAQQRWTELIDRRMDGTVWVSGGCRSWYLDATGRNSTIWPGYATGFRLRLGRFRPDDSRRTDLGESTPGGADVTVRGQTIFITGAARGIGEHVARVAAARGSHVFLVGLEADRLATLAAELDGGWHECDVTDQAALAAAVDAAVEAHGAHRRRGRQCRGRQPRHRERRRRGGARPYRGGQPQRRDPYGQRDIAAGTSDPRPLPADLVRRGVHRAARHGRLLRREGWSRAFRHRAAVGTGAVGRDGRNRPPGSGSTPTWFAM